MASSLNADNGVVSGSSGLKSTADTSGVLALQSNGTTGLTLNTSLALGVGSGNSTGNSGQALISAGSGAPPAWQDVASATYRNVTTTTTDITLTTADGGGYLTVTSTANVNINLPAANALTNRTITIKNIGQFAMLVYDNAGNYLFPLVPEPGVTCWASVATTAAGTWTINDIPPAYVSPLASAPGSGAGYTMHSGQSNSSISSTQMMTVYVDNSNGGIYGLVATNTSGVMSFGTPQLLQNATAAGTGATFAGCMVLSSTLAVVTYNDNVANLKAFTVIVVPDTELT